MDITLKKTAGGSEMLPRPSIAWRTPPTWIRQLPVTRDDADKRLKNGWYERGGGRFVQQLLPQTAEQGAGFEAHLC